MRFANSCRTNLVWDYIRTKCYKRILLHQRPNRIRKRISHSQPVKESSSWPLIMEQKLKKQQALQKLVDVGKLTLKFNEKIKKQIEDFLASDVKGKKCPHAACWLHVKLIYEVDPNKDDSEAKMKEAKPVKGFFWVPSPNLSTYHPQFNLPRDKLLSYPHGRVVINSSNQLLQHQ